MINLPVDSSLFFGGALNFLGAPGSPWWAIITPLFGHADYDHLISNNPYLLLPFLTSTAGLG